MPMNCQRFLIPLSKLRVRVGVGLMNNNKSVHKFNIKVYFLQFEIQGLYAAHGPLSASVHERLLSAAHNQD